MPEYYGDLEFTLQKISIQPHELGIEDEENGKTAEEKFEEFVEKLLKRAKSYIDYNRNRSFDEYRPPLVDDIAERIAIKMINIITRDQTNQIVEIGEFTMNIIEDIVLTDNMRKDLNLLPRGSEFSSKGSIQMGLIADLDEEEKEGLP